MHQPGIVPAPIFRLEPSFGPAGKRPNTSLENSLEISAGNPPRGQDPGFGIGWCGKLSVLNAVAVNPLERPRGRASIPGNVVPDSSLGHIHGEEPAAQK